MELTVSYDEITLDEVHEIFMSGKPKPFTFQESTKNIVFDSFKREVRVIE